MSNSDGHGISEQELRTLEVRVEELIRACNHLKDENRMLRVHQETLQSERSELMEKNEQAKSRVDAMITRLRSLETNT